MDAVSIKKTVVTASNESTVYADKLGNNSHVKGVKSLFLPSKKVLAKGRREIVVLRTTKNLTPVLHTHFRPTYTRNIRLLINVSWCMSCFIKE